jgi:hypothetical protein
MHLKPTAGCQISTLIFGAKSAGKTFDVNPKWQRTLPSVGNFHGICIGSPQIEISKLIPYAYPMKNSEGRQSSLPLGA